MVSIFFAFILFLLVFVNPKIHIFFFNIFKIISVYKYPNISFDNDLNIFYYVLSPKAYEKNNFFWGFNLQFNRSIRKSPMPKVANIILYNQYNVKNSFSKKSLFPPFVKRSKHWSVQRKKKHQTFRIICYPQYFVKIKVFHFKKISKTHTEKICNLEGIILEG